MTEDLAIPRDLRARMRDVAAKHGLGTPREAAVRFAHRGLDRYDTPPGALRMRLAHAVESQGYSSEQELVEHLLLRALRAYEEPTTSADQLAARLRGLGYIE
jgi:hypothetical protein